MDKEILARWTEKLKSLNECNALKLLFNLSATSNSYTFQGLTEIGWYKFFDEIKLAPDSIHWYNETWFNPRRHGLLHSKQIRHYWIMSLSGIKIDSRDELPRIIENLEIVLASINAQESKARGSLPTLEWKKGGTECQ